MRPHILGLVHAVLLSGAISDPIDNTVDAALSAAVSPPTSVTATTATTEAPPVLSLQYIFFPRPLHTSPADSWAPLRTQCPLYAAPDPVPSSAPILAPTPLPEPDAADELESFEEWKRRQEAEDAQAQAPAAVDDEPRIRENASLGAEAAEPAALDADTNNTDGDASSNPSTNPPPPPAPAPKKDKHRYNYASPDCSARVIGSSPLTQHASSLLHKSRDRYMLTPCRADEHWVIVELCDEIRVEAIELAVWEFFSGVVRTVVVSVGDEASGSSWTHVGEFVGKNVRGAQTFTLPEPTSFHRFLRLDFPSFYGQEYYCPVSQLKVHGMNQMEAFKMEQRRAAEATGAKNREREEAEREKEREREREREREAESERQKEREREAAEAVAREQQRVDDERRERELCELEKLVQEQARRAGDVVLEPSECIIEPPRTSESTTESTSAASEASAATATTQSANASISGNNNDSSPSTSAQVSAYTAPGSPKTDSSESIYAFIIRRLTALEGNSTLVARYIDEQAKALRAALTRAEMRWEAARERSDTEAAHRWESERMRQEDRLGRLFGQMEAMRATMEAERRLTESQLRVLTDELGFERRKSLMQLVILLLTIVLGVLSRGTNIEAVLRALAADGKRRTHARNRASPSRHQKRLSTGPLAGLLIDVASPTTSASHPTNPSTPTQSLSQPYPHSSHHSQTQPILQRSSSQQHRGQRPLTPASSQPRRRVTPNSRSFSVEPGALPMDLGDTEDLASPARRNLLSTRRRIARSAHLHPIRRRAGDESSEAEGRSAEGRVHALPPPSSVPSSAPTSPLTGLRPGPPVQLPAPSPAAVAAAIAAVKSGFAAAPDTDDITEDGASAPDSAADSASEVEDAVPSSGVAAALPAVYRQAQGQGQGVKGRRLLDRFNEIASTEQRRRQQEDDDEDDGDGWSIASTRSGKSGRTLTRLRSDDGTSWEAKKLGKYGVLGEL